MPLHTVSRPFHTAEQAADRTQALAHSPEHPSHERKEPLNGDGFGLGWYAPRLSREPAVFHSVTPAWNNRNLSHLARVIASPCVFAHVRAASPGSVVDLSNCHPFTHGRHLFMHNGSIAGFRDIRRHLLQSLSDMAFNTIRGSTDTEHMFAVFLDETLKPPTRKDPRPEPADLLCQQLSATLQRVLQTTRSARHGEANYLNVAVSDGTHAAVCRFTDDDASTGDSLYFLHGDIYETTADEFGERRHEEEDTAIVVSSERLTGARAWQAVPRNHMLSITRGQPPRLLSLAADGSLA